MTNNTKSLNKKAKIIKIGTCVKNIHGGYALSGFEFDAQGAKLQLSKDGFMGWSYKELEGLSRKAI